LSKRNDTLEIVLQQEFFTNIQDNLVNQLFALIAKKSINVRDGHFAVPELIKFDFDLLDLRLVDVSLDPNPNLVQLLDDEFQFGFKNLKGSLKCDYSYASDPPLFGDIGSFETAITNNSWTMDIQTNMS